VDRRAVGVLVLVVAVIAALVGNARTKQVGGVAHRGPIPGPPQVGECVLDAPGRSALESLAGASVDQGSEADYPSFRLGACAPQRFGEVAGVLPDGLDRPANHGDPWGDPDSPQRSCSDMVDDYIASNTHPGEGLDWWPAPSTWPIVIAPDAVQRVDGQRWLACAVSGFDPVGGNGDGIGIAYTGSVRGMMRTLRFPPELAQCLDNQPSASGSRLVECHQPHRAELLAVTFSSDPHSVDADALADRCVQLARSMTGLVDPTAGGRLQVRTIAAALPPDPAAADAAGANPMQWSCTVEPLGGRVLVGPLLGLDGAPVPLG
jgi:hypothetical protein